MRDHGFALALVVAAIAASVAHASPEMEAPRATDPASRRATAAKAEASDRGVRGRFMDRLLWVVCRRGRCSPARNLPQASARCPETLHHLAARPRGAGIPARWFGTRARHGSPQRCDGMSLQYILPLDYMTHFVTQSAQTLQCDLELGNGGRSSLAAEGRQAHCTLSQT